MQYIAYIISQYPFACLAIVLLCPFLYFGQEVSINLMPFPFQAGIIANRNVHKMPHSGTEGIRKLVKKSNVEFPGKWVYRIDGRIRDVEKQICRKEGNQFNLIFFVFVAYLVLIRHVRLLEFSVCG